MFLEFILAFMSFFMREQFFVYVDGLCAHVWGQTWVPWWICMQRPENNLGHLSLPFHHTLWLHFIQARIAHGLLDLSIWVLPFPMGTEIPDTNAVVHHFYLGPGDLTSGPHIWAKDSSFMWQLPSLQYESYKQREFRSCFLYPCW